MPAALYRLCREPQRGSNPNPVVISTRGARTTSKQVSDYFLCADCEDRFNKGGEASVLDQCARPDGSFKLRDSLKRIAPFRQEKEFSVVRIDGSLDQAADALVYFAASIFWRAAARQWTSGSGPVGRISLGNKYQEQFRLYLLGATGFPPNARVFAFVPEETTADPMVVFPCTTRIDGVHRHRFRVPGIEFILFLGRQVSMEYDLGAPYGTQGRFIWLTPRWNSSLFHGVLRRIAQARCAAANRGR